MRRAGGESDCYPSENVTRTPMPDPLEPPSPTPLPESRRGLSRLFAAFRDVHIPFSKAWWMLDLFGLSRPFSLLFYGLCVIVYIQYFF